MTEADQMDIREWSQRQLVHTGAADVCSHHGLIMAVEDVRAVEQAVALARSKPLSNISADGAELAILHIYLSLPDVCAICERSKRLSEHS